MLPFFNTSGPCIPGEHYMLPPERRLGAVLALIEARRYFTLHAGRQTGKTTSAMWLEDHLNASGRFRALWVDLETARPTPRVIGRFALELFEGKTLVERARFDFPGLIDGDFADAGHADPPRFDRKMTTRIAVMFPRTSRGTKLELWDRATNKRFPLNWPPVDEKR